MYRVCCPCIYKKQKAADEKLEKGETEADEKGETKRRRSSDEKLKKKPPSKTTTDTDAEIHVDHESDDEVRDRLPYRKYGTIGHITTATVVAEPPPMFARFMLRKSVHQLNTEVCLN